jgi:hypothetical protein
MLQAEAAAAEDSSDDDEVHAPGTQQPPQGSIIEDLGTPGGDEEDA